MAKELMKVYTLEELVEVLQVTRRTLYNYIKEGKLKAVKVGKYWRVREDQLRDFLSTGEEPGRMCLFYQRGARGPHKVAGSDI